MGYFGKFSIEVADAETGKIKKSIPEQENLILNQLFSNNSHAGAFSSVYCHFGTGSSPVLATDTSLSSPLVPTTYLSVQAGYLSPIITTHSKVDDVFSHEKKCIFKGAQGAVVGNISEIALSYFSSAGNIFSRALIKDVNGSPTTISLGPNDILTVTYRFGFTVDFSNPLVESKVIDIGGVPTTCSLYWACFDSPSSKSFWSLGDAYALRANPLTPMYNLRYIYPFSGTISNLGSPAGQAAGIDLLFSNKVDSSDGVSLKSTYKDQVVGAGELVGTWNGMFFSSAGSSIATANDATCVLVFDPPLEKGATDVFEISSFALFASRGV